MRPAGTLHTLRVRSVALMAAGPYPSSPGSLGADRRQPTRRGPASAGMKPPNFNRQSAPPWRN
jgi:hypothetical protein